VKISTPRSLNDRSSIYTGDSKEVLSIESNRIEISLNKTEKDLKPDFNDLIAKNMGTTANILFIKNNYLYLANVGDSMAVIFKNGEAIRLNQEHKVTLVSESTRISKSGAKIINNRIEGRLNLTRAIGIFLIVWFWEIIKNYIFFIK
jgi:serine/threonine protein phosphatase PrpC